MKTRTRMTIETKKAQLEVLERLMRELDSIEDDVSQRYCVVGKTNEQARDWRTNELLWEDEAHTIPEYKDKWDYVPVSEDEMSEAELAKLEAVRELRGTLEDLI